MSKKKTELNVTCYCDLEDLFKKDERCEPKNLLVSQFAVDEFYPEELCDEIDNKYAGVFNEDQLDLIREHIYEHIEEEDFIGKYFKIGNPELNMSETEDVGENIIAVDFLVEFLCDTYLEEENKEIFGEE